MHNVVQCIPADCTEYERWQCTAVACAGARGIKLNTPVISLSPLVVSLNCTLCAPPCYAVLELDEMKQRSFLIGLYTVHSRYNACLVCQRSVAASLCALLHTTCCRIRTCSHSDVNSDWWFSAQDSSRVLEAFLYDCCLGLVCKVMNAVQ